MPAIENIMIITISAITARLLRRNFLSSALINVQFSALTVEGCKSFRAKREEEQELAELSQNRIIEPETSRFHPVINFLFALLLSTLNNLSTFRLLR